MINEYNAHRLIQLVCNKFPTPYHIKTISHIVNHNHVHSKAFRHSWHVKDSLVYRRKSVFIVLTINTNPITRSKCVSVFTYKVVNCTYSKYNKLKSN